MTTQPALFGDEEAPPSKWATLFSAKSDEWPTDQAVFDDLARRFGPFAFDAAATDENHKCPRYATQATDGLSQPWASPTWCNPPYSDVEAWIAKGLTERARGVTSVFLLPARTDTRWFHMVLAAQDVCEVIFCRGRLRFGTAKAGAPFPSLVIVMRG